MAGTEDIEDSSEKPSTSMEIDNTNDDFVLEPALIELFPLRTPWNQSDNIESSLIFVIQDVVNFDLTPAIAAERMDEMIFAEHRDAENPTKIMFNTSEETQIQNSSPPARAGFVLDALPGIVTRIPADHPGQERLIFLLKMLQRTPARTVTLKPAGGTKALDLWSKIDQSHGFVEDCLEFWESRIFPWNPFWSCPKGNTAELESYSAFSAKLFVSGIYSMKAGNAIEREPFATAIFNGVWKRPLLEDFEPYACSAAQWIFYAGAQLFEMCQKKAYKPERWDDWKTKFERTAGSLQLSHHCRETALHAVRRMAQIEQDGVTTNVVHEYGMSFMDGDTLVSANPNSRAYFGKRSQWNEYAEDGKD